jgi:hypothetical protein
VPFFEWVRRNSEEYLMEAAQRDMARRYGRPAPAHRRGPGALFWRWVFTPIYRRLPWRLRRAIIVAMPGSHRRRWVGRAPPGP